MEGTRLEIFTDGKWVALELFNKTSIKYNKLVNRIGNINTRELSHTNTFSIIPTYNNRQMLGINVFNAEQLAKALNSKYEAKYYVEEKIVQEGFVIINQSNENVIKLNFIDEALDLVDRWGETEFRDLLNNPSLPIPQDYKDAINEMKNYSLPFNSIATPLSQVGSRGHNLALFPHNLNTIGDEYGVDANGDRPNNSFSPYQSRPLFNSKAIFDLACSAYGYTPIYDLSIDEDDIEKTYIVPSGLNDNFTDDGVTSEYGIVDDNDGSRLIDSSFDRFAVIATNSRSLIPNNVNGWVDPESGFIQSYRSLPTIFVPNLNRLPSGIIRFTTNVSSSANISANNTYAVYSNSTFGSNVIFKSLFIENEVIENNSLKFDINKNQLFDKPNGADEFLGIFSTIQTNLPIFDYQITETFLPIESVSYDERGQFQTQSLDLTYAAPNETVKDLIVGLMRKDGILMNINNRTKEVLFYNYSRYQNQREGLVSTDFSDYLIEAERFDYNTNFGNDFAKLNEIGLSEPFKGNTFFITLDNQGQESKLKDFAENFLPKFKDVEAVNRIPNTQTPYTEFTNTGLGLVTLNGELGNLTQVRFVEELEDGQPSFISQGEFFGLSKVENVRFNNVPRGISNWYFLVGNAIKANPKFLIPVDVIRNIDLTSPIYIEQMGGFYIIEEISEYQNSQTPVEIKVIKLVDGAEFSDDFSNAFNI